MILNPEKLKKLVDDDVRMFYEYDITKDSDEVTRVVSFGYVKPSNGIIVGIVTTKDGVHELTENKDFDASSTGFDEATDYFESLIIKETSPKNQNQENENSAPPVGLLFSQSNDGIKVVMQDGRKGDFTQFDFLISDNILTFTKTKNGFENNEKYYVDVIPNSPDPNMFALYPVDEQQGGVTQEIDDYSGKDLKKVANENQEAQKGGNQEGNQESNQESNKGESKGEGNPSNEDKQSEDGGKPSKDDGKPSKDGGKPSEGEGNPSGDGGESSGEGGEPSGDESDKPSKEYSVDKPKAQEILAKTYGMRQLSDLLYNFGGKENLMNDILNFSEMEKTGLLNKLGSKYSNDSQFEAVIRNVINE